jgi:hypothetical protein
MCGRPKIYGAYFCAADNIAAVQDHDQPEKASQNAADEHAEESETHSLPKMEPPYRFKLGASQKKRSRLVQQTDAVPAPAATGNATPAAPEVPQAEPPPQKRVRLKRSGQMHEDVNGPLPDPLPKRDDQY